MKVFLLSLLLTCALSGQSGARRSDDSRQMYVQGIVHEISDRQISIEVKDNRVVTFKITASTQFKDGLSVKALQRGDRLLVQGMLDQDAYLVATNIALDGAAMAADAAASAAARIISAKLNEGQASALIDNSIKDLGSRLN